MNICFILISDGWGGGETVVYQMIHHLIKKNVDVSLILNNEMERYFQDLDIKIFNLGSLYDSKSLLKMIFKPKKTIITDNSRPVKLLNMILMYLYFKRASKKIDKFLNDNKIHIIHSNLEYADILAYVLQRGKNNGQKWISTVHGHWFTLFFSESNLSTISNRIFIKFLKKAFRSMDKIIFVSKYLQDRSLEIFAREMNKKSSVIYNGVDLTNINIKTLKLKKGFNILFPGGYKYVKGGDIVINAINILKSQIPDLNLYIALEVPPHHLIRKLVDDYGLNEMVNFVGFLDSQDYLSLLNSVDLLVMPSRMEALGITYLEAMALGIPVVASNTGGITEIVKNMRNGITTDPEPQKVADAILMQYKDQDLRKKMSKNNLTDIHQFQWDKIADKYLKIYESII